MNILVTGSDGQLGQCFKKYYNIGNDNYFFKNKKNLNIVDYNQVDNFIKKNQINIIINCAAYTNVDKAESEKKKCFDINVLGLENLVKLSIKYDAFLIHFSTDYVFDGNNERPLLEDDLTSPINYYGSTKLESEKVFLLSKSRGVIFRISWLYSRFGKNFYTNILDMLSNSDAFEMVVDQYSSPTNADALAMNIAHLIKTRRILSIKSNEIFHFSDTGYCSKYDFVMKLNKFTFNRKNISPISYDELQFFAKRPKFSAFNNSKVQRYFGISLSAWNLNLNRYVKEN